MPINANNSLISTARFLREQDEQTALNHFLAVGRQSPEIENQVYRRLWEVMDRPNTHADFGRAAFWNRDHQSAPLSKKTQAIEDILNTLSERPARTEPNIPEGAKKVDLDAFHDCGFDPRFDPKGDYQLPQAKFSFSAWASEWIAYIEFTLRAHFSLDPAERALRQMILSTARTESQFSKYTQSAFVRESGFGSDISNTFTSEHEFFNQTSDLFKTALPPAHTASRLFPSELLKASHSLAKPQAYYWDKSHLRPGNQNGDLSRCAHVGLWRLREEMYIGHGGRLDQFEYRFVPHYIFNHATNARSEELKTAMRSYRTTLSSLVVDQKCARSFAVCKEKLLPSLATFNTAWQNYVDSH
ncbi:MAG: hypothetical protein HYX67_13100, partial [Candidatus Melainabacteria bacterium]|nr:hypothetical protein [Candidatus Melainabacteria bacterium]